jgi:hypothetical protein
MTRKIKGPEDVTAWLNENTRADESPRLVVFSSEQVGQIIFLAMDAAAKETEYQDGLKVSQAWRELAERLRGSK